MSSGRSSGADAKPAPKPKSDPSSGRAWETGRPGGDAQRWLFSHRFELAIFLGGCFVLACFSGQRFLRQSAAPHFVYQAQAWLEGHLDVDPRVLPNLEDWACVHTEPSPLFPGELRKLRCVGRAAPRSSSRVSSDDRWYVSFPPVPAVLMLPFVALHGYQFNDTSFTVIVAALALVLAYRFVRRHSGRDETESAGLTWVLGFGTLFFYCAIRGEVWFSAEVIGVAFTFLYLGAAVRARRPLLAGIWYALATLTRTPLVFSLVFFLLECVAPDAKTPRIEQLRAFLRHPRPAFRPLALFFLGAAPFAIAAATFNQIRFGHLSEFGHAFLFNNRVNADIDRHGLFSVTYLARNLQSAFLMLPRIQLAPLRLSYDPNGLSLLFTLPWLVLLFIPKAKHRLQAPLWITVAACALPGLLYQNNGYMQFGFRFSLDYTPYLWSLLAVSGWQFRSWALRATLALGVLVNFWGALAFRGYTELMRHW